MSFLRTLATVAVGVAAAKGVSKYRQMGGMSGMQEMMKGMQSGQGSMMDQLGQMAEKMGVPGGAGAMQDMMAKMGLAGTGNSPTAEAGAAGFGGLMAAMSGAAQTGGQQMDEMLQGLFKDSPVSQAAEENAKLMIRAMIQAAKADGEIDDAEKAAILEKLQDAGPEEIAFVKAQLDAPVDLMALAQDATEASRAQVYSTSLMAIRVDHDAEIAYLQQLSQALGLPRATVDSIHAQMGLAPLPA